VVSYDWILRLLGRACRGLEQGDRAEKHAGLAKAEGLLIELRRSLDFGPAPELAGNLARIYSFVIDELARADAEDNAGRIRAVMGLVGELRETWAEAAKTVAGAGG